VSDGAPRAIFFGEEPVHSAPTRTIARHLAQRGWATSFAGRVPYESTGAWVRMCRRADLLVVIGYGTLGPQPFTTRQLALAVALGTPLVRVWVGTDVLFCLEDPAAKDVALRLGRCASAQVAVAPHLVRELASLGVTAGYAPSLTDLAFHDISLAERHVPRGVLVYLPSERREFYGGTLVLEAARRLPQMTFHIVADDEHALAGEPNVVSHGWVEDLSGIWEEVGCVLRVTAHDGLPRMVLEALARGKHVIYGWPLDGCVYARDVDAVVASLERIDAAEAPNVDGRRVAAELLEPPPGCGLGDALSAAATRGVPPRARARATVLAVRASLEMRRTLSDRDAAERDGTAGSGR
jgi:hypothetical protein